MNTKILNKLPCILASLGIIGSFALAYLPRNAEDNGEAHTTALSVLEDTGGNLTLDDVLARKSAFVPEQNPPLFRSRSDSAFWLSFSVTGQKPGTTLVLEIANPSLEEISIYFPGHQAILAGKRVPARHLDFGSRLWNIPIPADMPADSTILVRVRSNTNMWIPIQIMTTSAMVSKAIFETLLFGIFFGILTAVFFVNLFSFIIMGNRTFLFYLLYVASLIVNHLRVHGFLYLLSVSYPILEAILWLSLAGVGIFMLLFTKQFLELKKRMPVANRLMDTGIALFAVQTAFGLSNAGLLANQIAYISGLAMSMIIFFTAARLFYTGRHETRFYLLGWCAMFTGTSIWSAAAYIEPYVSPGYFYIAGTSVYSLLFTLAIFDQVKNVLNEKEALGEREKYYQDLSRTDALTGLYNRRHLTDIVKRLESSGEMSGETALIMIDLDHFKETNDNHGHLIGDLLLSKTGTKIKKHIRKTDIACRYGGDEFLILLPNANLTAASNIAEAIRQEILDDFCYTETGDKVQSTVSIGITVNRVSDSFDGLFLRADAALYQAKKTGRNRISIL